MDEVDQHLTEQVAFLMASARAFDGGNLPEAKRMATTLRVLLHQTSDSRALLNQRGVLSSMEFFDGSPIELGRRLLSGAGLVDMAPCDDGWRYVPKLIEEGRWMPFDSWWKRPVIVDGKRRESSRRTLVLAVANTDGGAHVGKMKAPYVRLTRSNSLGAWGDTGDGGWEALGNPVLPTIRQITYEALLSLDREFPGLAPTH